MYPTLYDFLVDLFGTELPALTFLRLVNSFGFFVALGFIITSYVWGLEVKRKSQLGLIPSQTLKIIVGEKLNPKEVIINALIGFVFAYKLIGVFFFMREFPEQSHQDYIFSLEGNFIAGLIGGAWMGYSKYKELKKQELPTPKEETVVVEPHSLIGNMTIYAAVFGILGAKIFHQLENWDDFVADPIGQLLSFSGLTFYGGLICGAAGVLWYAKKNKIPLLHLMDACAPTLLLAYGIGRIGCQVSGDGDWGIPNPAPMPDALSFLPDWIWSYTYPNNVHGLVLETPVWPTPLYESTVSILFFFILWSFRKKIDIPGLMFSIYLIINGLERFFIEKIRENTELNLFGFHPTQAEVISTILILIGITGVFYFRKRFKANLA